MSHPINISYQQYSSKEFASLLGCSEEMTNDPLTLVRHLGLKTKTDAETETEMEQLASEMEEMEELREVLLALDCSVEVTLTATKVLVSINTHHREYQEEKELLEGLLECCPVRVEVTYL